MIVLRIVFQLIVGLVFGLAAAVALVPVLAAFQVKGSESPVGSFVVIGAVCLLTATAPTMRRAFGRGFLCLGAAVFVLPLSMMLLSGRVLTETVDAAADGDKAMTAIGGALAGGVMTGMAGFIGFFLGAVLLLFGLVLSLGGRREVVVVRR